MLFGHCDHLNNALKLSLHKRMNDMRVGVKTSTSLPLSAEHQESTMFQPWGIYPLILQTLVNYQLNQNNMKRTHLKDTDITALHVTNWCSPVQMMRVLWHQMHDAANTPVSMLIVQSTGEQNFHLQWTTACVTPSHPHQTYNSSSQMHGMMIQLPVGKTSQQHPWMTNCGLKIQFQIDTCAPIRHLTSQMTNVLSPVHTTPQPSGWTCHSLHCRMLQSLTTR